MTSGRLTGVPRTPGFGHSRAGRTASCRPDPIRSAETTLTETYTTKGTGRAETALVAQGFAPEDVKLYTGKQILSNHEQYMERRGITSKVVGSVVDDVEGRELYLGYAREDRCAMWVRIPDERDVPKALRVLADHDYLHTRYYGSEQQTDFHVS